VTDDDAEHKDVEAFWVALSGKSKASKVIAEGMNVCVCVCMYVCAADVARAFFA
jgi:hypothetical protein